jgi:Putative zinc-finger
MMLNCKEASRLISQRQDRALTVGERLSLRTHFAICAACVRVSEQVDFLRKALARYAGRDSGPDEKR